MHLFSASQLSTFDVGSDGGCERKWGLLKIAGLPSPSGPAAALGTEVDDEQLQPYLRDGKPFDYTRPSGSGYVAASMLGFLPEPQLPGLEVQRHFEIPSPTWIEAKGADVYKGSRAEPVGHVVNREHIGFGFQGFQDLWLPDSRLMPLFPEELDASRCVPMVGDFKTTGDLKWMKTPEKLKTDPQAMLYATEAMFSTGARVVDLVWIYGQTKVARKSKRSWLRVEAAHVAEQYQRLNKIALRMWSAKKAADDVLASGGGALEHVLTTLPPNPDSCEAFGGCPFRSTCNLSPDQIVDAHAAKHEALRGLKENTMANASGGVDMMARLAAKRAGLAAAPSFGTPPPVTDADRVEAAARVAALIAGTDVAINPPESLLPPAPAVGVSAAPSPAPEGAATPKRRGPGRPKKDPLGADAAAHTGIGTPHPEVAAIEERTAQRIASVVRDAEEGTDLVLSTDQRHARIGAIVVELFALLSGAA